MRIYKRYCDKVSLVIYVVCIFIAFVASLSLFSYVYLRLDDFYQAINVCYQTKSFNCMVEAVNDYNIHKDLLLTVISLILSIAAAVIGFLIMSIYKSISFGKDKKDG